MYHICPPGCQTQFIRTKRAERRERGIHGRMELAVKLAAAVRGRFLSMRQSHDPPLNDGLLDLGVADALAEIPGLTTPMLVALGEKSVKTIEDLADCATDDLLGWSERKDKETVRHEGILSGFGIGRPEIEDLILAARVKAGWISEADLAPPPVEDEPEAGEAGEAVEAEPQPDGAV